MKKWQYYGLFIGKEAYDKLIDTLVDYQWIGTMNDSEKEYIDHCTLLHKKQADEEHRGLLKLLELNLGKSVRISITGVGLSDRAMAFKVDGIQVICANKTPHITICTFNGGKPVDSNDITKWEDFDEPIVIDTILKRI